MDQTAKDKALQHMAAMSSAQIVSATAIHNKLGLPGIPRPTFPGAPGFWPGMIQTGQPGSSQDVKPFVQQAYPIQPAVTAPIPGFEPASAPAPSVPAWQGRSIGTTKLRLVEFSAFLEQQRDPDSYNKHLFVHIGHANHSYSDPLLESVDIRQIYDKFPEKKGGLKELFGKGPQNAFFLVKFWADLNCNIQDDAGAFYGVTSQYESSENMTVTCSTKVCSFGKQVVEKVETEYARFENGRFVYRINRSPMCEYMINFIHKLKHLPEKYMMNSVLENFTILLVVTNRDTQETLLCMACVFEVSNSEHGAQHHIYRLVKDWAWLFIYMDICIYTHTHLCTHTLSLHSWMTDCNPHHTGRCPGPEVTPTFLTPVWVKSFFHVLITIIVAVKFWYSCKKRNRVVSMCPSDLQPTIPRERGTLTHVSLCRDPVSDCGRKYWDRALAMGHFQPLYKCILFSFFSNIKFFS